MPRELAPAVSPTRLPADAVNDAFVSAVVPPGLATAEDARARSDAAAFLAMLLRHLDGDPGALPEIAAAVRAVAGEVVRGGDNPGILLDRFDRGRPVILRALLERGDAT